MKLLRYLIEILKKYKPIQMAKLAYYILPRDMLNINLDMCDTNQKRVLISYLYLFGIDLTSVKHANWLHYNQMIKYFISRGYCVDTCYCMDNTAFERLGNRKYDVIIGFGTAFKEFCTHLDIPNKILFIMENHPDIVRRNYQQRLEYFKKRHPKISTKIDYPRDAYFDKESFEITDKCILMSSSFNERNFVDNFSFIRTINANAIFNEYYKFKIEEVKKWIGTSKSNFLWFGSDGFIHKGVDIILDVFRSLPELHIDLYGISERERPLYRKLRSLNSEDCGRIDVHSEKFIEDVIKKHTFVIFPSCSEGMSTAVCTCMAHGLIPIITKETGSNAHRSIIEISDYRVESVKAAILKAIAMDDMETLDMRRCAYEYGQEQFSLRHFSKQFTTIMDEML